MYVFQSVRLRCPTHYVSTNTSNLLLANFILLKSFYNYFRINDCRFFSKYYAITSVKYSMIYLSGKLENLERILADLESEVIKVTFQT